MRHCLYSFLSQDADPTDYDILIVDNYSSNPTYKEIEQLANQLPNASAIQETKAGLSYARNAGMNHVFTPWLGYIDDDCQLPSDFVSIALNTIKGGSFESFGGHVNNWWLTPKPQWLPEDYGTKPILSKEPKTLDDDQYIWGGNMFFKTALLKEVNGFDENIGMKADHIGYSAENRVQMKLRKEGIQIGYLPSLIVDHLVAPHKYQLRWHLKAAYAEGRDGRAVFPEQYRVDYLLREVMRFFKTFIYSLYKWLFDKNYCWQNAVLDSGKILFRLAGKLKARLF